MKLTKSGRPLSNPTTKRLELVPTVNHLDSVHLATFIHLNNVVWIK